jgi:hypothetical protein
MSVPAESSIALERSAAEPASPNDPTVHNGAPLASCDYCGSARLEWRKCKLICADCRQINKSCADL